MKVLLTGATGFIGWEVLKRLLAQGDSIRVLIRPETLAHSDRGRELQNMNAVEVLAGDLSDAKAVIQAADNIEVVYHLAWESKPSVLGVQGPADEALAHKNIGCTENLLAACAKQKIRRLVYTSTVSVYGSSSKIMDKWPVNEEAPYFQGPYEDDYSINTIKPKIATETRVQQVAKESGFEYVILRPSIVYGVGSRMADRMALQALQDPRQDQGMASRRLWPMIHVRDVADAVVLGGRCPEAAGREFNIARGEAATYNEMVQMLRAAAFRINRGLPLPGRFLGQWQGNEPYDTTKAQVFLNFTPKVSLAEGLAEIMASAMGVPPSESPVGAYAPVGSPVGAHAAALAQVYDRWLDANLLDDYYEHSNFWNWGYWDSKTKTQREACENLMEKMLAFIPKKEGTILEVACGKGATARHLLRYYKPENVTAINISERQLEICRKTAPGVNFKLMDAASLDFPDESFDNVICVEAAANFDTREKFLRGALRVLKPGGRLVLCDAVFPLRTGVPPRERQREEANHVRNVEEYREICLRAGFKEVVAEDITKESWLGFYEHVVAYIEERRMKNTIDQRSYSGIMAYLNQMATTDFYALVSCKKAS